MNMNIGFKRFEVLQNRFTGYWIVYDNVNNEIWSKYEWPADAEQEAKKMNKKVGREE